MLGDIPDFLPRLRRWAAEDVDASGVRHELTEKQPEQSCLAPAVGSQKTDPLGGADGKTHLVQGVVPLSRVAESEVRHMDGGCVSHEDFPRWSR